MKIAFIGSLPAAAVLPEEFVREKDRGGNHPAPWIVALLPALAAISGFKLRMVLVQRGILSHCLIERDGVEFEGIPYPMPERFAGRFLHLPKALLARRALQRFQPDLVHAFGMETGSATIAMCSGFPVSCFIQGMWELLAPLKDGVPRGEIVTGRWCESVAVARIRWFVAENEFARQWAVGRNPAARVTVIPHPLRQDFLVNAAPTYLPQIITVGGLNRHKGMDTVIRAFAQMKAPSARLCIVGSGPLDASLKELAGALGLAERVEFTGALETDQVIERMNASTALVIGSRMDTSPNVVSEAHAIGLPVIGTRVGGIPEMIDEGTNGYVVDGDDAQAMGERMGRLLSDPETCRRMGEAGREKVRILNSPAAVAQAHVDFFLKIREELRRSP
jgi:glycosyltransferase involved in cell wall biosynthesis